MKIKFSIAIILFVFAAQAQAVCKGASCQNKDPKIERCDDGQIVTESYVTTDGRFVSKSSTTAAINIQLKWSPKCQAAWALMTKKTNSSNIKLGEVRVDAIDLYGHVLSSTPYPNREKASPVSSNMMSRAKARSDMFSTGGIFYNKNVPSYISTSNCRMNEYLSSSAAISRGACVARQ